MKIIDTRQSEKAAEGDRSTSRPIRGAAEKKERPTRGSAATKTPPARAAAVTVGILTFASAAMAQPFPRWDAPTFSRGGAIATSGTPFRDVYIVGQPIVGLQCAFNNDVSTAQLGIGFVPAISIRLEDLIGGYNAPQCLQTRTIVRWDVRDDCWCLDPNVPTNWTPEVVPNDSGTTRYHAFIEPHNFVAPPEFDPVVSLGFGPSVTRLTLGSDSVLQVGGPSSVGRALSFSNPPGPTGIDNVTSEGVFQVVADELSEVNLDFTIIGMNVDQSASGLLLADGSSGFPCTLTLTGCRIRGGEIQAFGAGRVRMLETILEDCLTGGDNAGTLRIQPGSGPTSTMRGTLGNSVPIEIEAGAQLATNSSGVVVDGAGEIRLRDQNSARLGGPDGVITHGSAPGAAHTIRGAGRITGRLLNNGTIEADTDDPNNIGSILTVNVQSSVPIPGFGAPFVNDYVMRASNGGTLRLSSAIQNNSEIISDADSEVEINSQVVGAGQMTVLGGGNMDFNSATVNGDCVETSPGSYVDLDSTTMVVARIGNTGGMLFQGGSNVTTSQSFHHGQSSPTALLDIAEGSQLTCQGVFTQFQGVTILRSGTVLRLSGPSGTLLGGAFFAGGTILGDLVNNGATIHPGESPGRMTINGNLTLNGGGLVAEVAGAPASANFDSILATGVVSLGGSLTVSQGAYTPTNTDQWNIVSAASVSGTFASVSLPSSQWRLCYLENNVQLRFGHPCPCPGDLDGDRSVSIADLAQLLSGFGTFSGATAQEGDSDGDGDIDISDLAFLLSRFGTVCPP